MFSTPRRIMVAVVVAGGLALSTAPAAHAIVDPFAVGGCLAQSAAELTTVIDPTAPGPPAEIPAVACLQP